MLWQHTYKRSDSHMHGLQARYGACMVKDLCYKKVASVFSKSAIPSAYFSGALVRCRKGEAYKKPLSYYRARGRAKGRGQKR